LCLDGRYVDWPDFVALCQQFDVESIPVVATIPFKLSEVRQLSEGKTLLMDQNAHIREGLMVKSMREWSDPKLGRVVLKYVSDSYLFGEKTDYMDQ